MSTKVNGTVYGRESDGRGWYVRDQVVFGLVDEAGAHAHRVGQLPLEADARFVRVRRA